MMTVKAYKGGCQCGAVRYEAKVDLDQIVACNCSRCGKLGSILTFTSEDQFSLESGEDSLTEYLFNKHAVRHVFCKVCGIQSFARGTAPDGRRMVAVNARCLDSIDVHTLTPKPIDGRSF
jgi:hypothetical protein